MRLRVILSTIGSSIILVAGFSGVAAAAAKSTVYVSHANCSNSGPGTHQQPFCTVQEGVGAVAAGGTINIQDGGVYSEQVTVKDKDNVTIEGYNSTIKMPTNVTTGGAILNFKNAKGWKVNHLNVSGPFTVNSCATEETGIAFGNNTSVNLQHVNVTDIRPADTNNFFGCQQGVGIYVNGSNNNPADITMDHVSVSNYSKDGIEVDGKGSNATIQQSIVTGTPTPLTALNGIQISRNATATLRQNTVTGNEYQKNDGYTASGLIIYQAGRVTATQNTISNNDVGFDIEGSNNGVYTQNTLNDNTTNGFYVSDKNGAAPTANNTFSHNQAANTTGTTEYTPYDVEDDTTGTKTAGTANTWQHTVCNTSLPAAICQQ